MPLDLQGTTLAQSPYYDDFDETKNFHRVLFKPSVAVQARELTQLQTILQSQIERFGDNIFRIGTIIKGCSLTTDTSYHYVKLVDLQTTGVTYDISALSNTYATETTTGLNALVVNYTVGAQQLDPDLSTLYLKYLNTGSGGQKTFTNDSILKIYNRSYSIQSVEIASPGTGYSNTDYLVFTGGGGAGATANIVTTSTGAILSISIINSGSGYVTAPTVSVANSTGGSSFGAGASLNAINYLAQVRVANTTYANAVGIGTAVKTSDGVIYQKGHFVRVGSHEVILSKYNTSANGVVVGFVTSEAVVNSNADSSLLDNASGATNYTAPGADRLKLTANLAVYSTAAAASANGFLALYEYENGQVIKDRTVTQFNSISRELNQRTFEESGNYVVKPFTVYTEGISGNNTHLNVVVQPGTAYVEGSRVEILNNTRYPISKANTTTISSTQSIATAFGGYVLVKEMSGAFDITTGKIVKLKDTARQALSTANTSATGVQLGTARIRSLVYESGTPGSGDCVYRMYLFDVRMASDNSGTALGTGSFKNVRQITDDTLSPIAIADVIVDATLGYTTQYDTDFDRLLFDSGTYAVKEFTNERATFRTSVTSTPGIPVGGSLQIALSGQTSLPYSVGALNSIQERDFIVVPSADLYLTSPKTGTVACGTGSNVVTGTATSFSTEYNVGDYVKIHTNPPLLITAITSNTSMQVAVNPTAAATANVHYVAFKANAPINFGPTSRSITIDSSTQFTINLGGTINAQTPATIFYNYEYGAIAEPTLRVKTANTSFVKISNTAVGANLAGPWGLGLPDAVELVGVYIGTGTTYADPNTATNYASQFILESGQTDNYYGLSSIKRRPGSSLTLGINNNLLVKVKVFTWTSGYYASTEAYNATIDDTSSTLPTNKIRTYQIPVYVSPKTGQKFDLRNSIDFRPQATATATYAQTAAAATVDPTSGIAFDNNDKRFPSPEKAFTANITSYYARKDRVVIDKYGQIRVISGVPANSPSAPLEPEETMTLGILNVPQYPSLSAAESSIAGRPDLAALVTPVQNRRFTMKDIGDIETRISRLEYYSLLNTLETQTKQLVLPGEVDNTIERFKNGFFVDPMTDYTISNINDTEYRVLIDTNKGIARPYYYDVKINLQPNTAASTGVTKSGDVMLLNYNESSLLEQSVATRDRTLVDKLWSYVGNVRTFPEFDNWHDTETRDTAITIDIYSPVASLAAATSAALSELKGSAVLVQGPQDVGTALQISGGQFGEQVWKQTTESLYKDTKVTLSGGASSTTSTSVGTFINDISVQRYIRPQRVYFLATGLRPGATHYVFFDSVLMTPKVAPHSTSLTLSTYTRDSFTQTAALGAALVANSSGVVAGSLDIPANTYFIGERSVVIMDVDNIASESTATSKAIGRFTAFGISTASTNLSISTKTVDTTASRGYNATSYFSSPYAVPGERTFTRVVPNPDPLSQTFKIQPQVTTSDGIYLTSIDLFFKQKDPVQGITVEIRETLNGVPTQIVLPFSRVYLPSSSVLTSATGTTATKFTFVSPVYVRTNVDYAIVVYPDANSPEYRVYTAVTGQKDLNSPNTIANQNWGLGTLFYSTSGSAWTAVQDEDLKFVLRRARFTSSTGTAVLHNGDYEFFNITNASGTMSGGEDVAQLGQTYLNTVITANTANAVISTSTNLSTTLANGDNVLLIYGTSPTPVSSANVNVVGTAVSNATGVANAAFTVNYSAGDFIRLGNTTVGEIRQVVLVTDNNSMTIDSTIFGTATNILQYKMSPTFQVAKVNSANSSTVTLNKVAKANTSTTIDTGVIATMQKVVGGIVETANYSNSVVYVANSTATNSTFKFLTSNSTYLATIVGDTSQAKARVSSITDLECNFFTPIFSKVIVGGTSLGLTASVSKSGGSTDTSVYDPSKVNKFEFTDSVKVKSKTNEIVGTTINKSFTSTVSFTAPASGFDVSPVLDVNPIGIVVTKNLISDEIAEIVYANTTATFFTVGETVTQIGSGAQGTVVSVSTDNNRILVKNTIGKFMTKSTNASYNITGGTSSANGVVKQVFDETSRFGPGKSKYISKRLTLAQNMDAEDIKVFLTAYKPLNTDIDVYARILNFTDGQAFEEKEWTRLDQVTSDGVYSSSYDESDYREFEYTFPYTPPSMRKTGIVSNTGATLTGDGTLFSTELTAGDLVKVVRTNTLTDYEVGRISSIANNTSLTLSSSLATTVTGATVELITQPKAAFKYNKNANVVRYYDNNGASYDTYRVMAIKIVLRSPYTYVVPTVNDVRALAVST